MKRNFLNSLLLLLLGSGSLLTSCNKILDIDPGKYVLVSASYYSTQEELETALRGVYAILAEDGLYGDYILGRLGLECDEGFTDYNADRGTSAFYEGGVTDTKILAYWQKLYQGISRANNILAHIDNPDSDIDDDKRRFIKGQALFLRGYFYFMLVNKFGGVPLILNPVESGKAENVQIPRSDIKTVYEQILADMTQAEGLVSYTINQVESPGRISKSAIQGILARVCLYMAGAPLNDVSKYADAAEWAKKVIENGLHSLSNSYKQIFINYAQDLYDKKESIWEVEFWGNGTGMYASAGGAVGHNIGIQYSGEADFGKAKGIIHPTIWMYNLYAPNDLRRDWVIAPYRYVADTIAYWPPSASILARYAAKFRREYEILLPKSATITPQNYPLLRYSDVLLMYAEALNEVSKGPTVAAYEAINQVRRRAVGSPANTPNSAVDLSSLSYEDFKKELKDERARELCYESLRKNDLIRWGDFYANMKKMLNDFPASGSETYIISGKLYYSNVGQRDIFWPIPSYEMGLNPKLVQNEDW